MCMYYVTVDVMYAEPHKVMREKLAVCANSRREATAMVVEVYSNNTVVEELKIVTCSKAYRGSTVVFSKEELWPRKS